MENSARSKNLLPLLPFIMRIAFFGACGSMQHRRSLLAPREPPPAEIARLGWRLFYLVMPILNLPPILVRLSRLAKEAAAYFQHPKPIVFRVMRQRRATSSDFRSTIRSEENGFDSVSSVASVITFFVSFGW
jgi:hypothetical protein